MRTPPWRKKGKNVDRKTRVARTILFVRKNEHVRSASTRRPRTLVESSSIINFPIVSNTRYTKFARQFDISLTTFVHLLCTISIVSSQIFPFLTRYNKLMKIYIKNARYENPYYSINKNFPQDNRALRNMQINITYIKVGLESKNVSSD